MKIQTKLQLHTLCSVAMVLVIGVVLFLTSQQQHASAWKDRLANAIVKDVFELDIITHNYLLQHSERARLQWQRKDASVSHLLTGAEYTGTQEREVFGRIRRAQERMQGIFSQLIANAERHGHSQHQTQVALKLEKLLADQLTVQAQAMVSHAGQLAALSQAEGEGVRHRGNVLVLVLVMVVATVTGAISWGISRSVMQPITKLHEGIASIREGNLLYKVDITTTDEIGRLAQAFDQMTVQLHHTYGELTREIGERAQAEEALTRQTQELARSNAELEQFAYVASHDLQEPLRKVTNYTQLFVKRYAGELDAKAEKYIDYIQDGTARMQGLIQDLLTYSRASRGDATLEAVDMHEVLQKTLATLELTLADTQAEVTAEALPTIQANPTQMGQLLQNLLGNALKFRSDAPPRIHVSAESKPTEWAFAVRDNGIGLDPQYVERIFIIFQRLHSRAAYPGTGIGLAICKRIVQRHGGRIWVESEPGKGTTFYFTLSKRQDTPLSPKPTEA